MVYPAVRSNSKPFLLGSRASCRNCFDADLLYLGQSRCFPFWQEVLACYVVNTNSEDDSGKVKCKPVLEDYYECLHHKKEVKSSRLEAENDS